jgi:Ca2+-binding EF-hand superfamily protein
VSDVIRRNDVDGDGRLNREEFQKLMSRRKK